MLRLRRAPWRTWHQHHSH